MRQQGAPAPKQPAPAAGAPERGGFPGAARVMAPRQQPAKGAACPRPPGQAAGAGPNGQPVGHGRRPLTGACACALAEGCRRVRLRTGGALARGRGIFKQGRKERRRHRLRRAGGLRSRPGRKGAAQLRRAARIARRRGRRGSGALLASHAGMVGGGRGRLRRAARATPEHRHHAGQNHAPAPRSRGSSRKSRALAGSALRWA